MSDETKEITVTIPTQLLGQIEEKLSQEGMTLDEFVSVTIERSLSRERWEETFRYGRRKAREMGIKPEDVPRLIEEYRAEVAAAAAR